MLSKRDYKKLHYLIQFAFIAVFIFIGYLAFKYVFGAVAPFIIAVIAASLIEAPVRFLTKKFKFPRSLASSICIVLLLIIVAALFAFLSTFIWKEGKALVMNIPGYIRWLVEYVEKLMQNNDGIFAHLPDETIAKLSDYIVNYDYSSLITGSLGSEVIGYAGNVVVYIPNAIVFIIVTIVSSMFMSISFPIVKRFILAQLNEKQREIVIEIKQTLFLTVWKYLRSYSILMLITFIELWVFFLIFGFKPALPLAFLIAIVDILPILGVGTVLIPWSLISLLTGSPWQALILICMYIVITVIRQILEPKVIGHHVGMLPILTLFCIWVGLKLFGFLGMFMIPIAVVILKHLHETGKVKIWKDPEIEEGA